MNPCRLMLWVTTGADTGCKFATLTQPVPTTWVWQVLQHLPVSVIESHMATQCPVVFFYHHLHHPLPILLPTAANHPCMPLPSPEGCGLTWLGVWQEEHKGGPSKWEAQLVCCKNGPWLMAHSHSSLLPGPQLMSLPPPATLSALIWPCKPSYKHDENQPTLCHSGEVLSEQYQ